MAKKTLTLIIILSIFLIANLSLAQKPFLPPRADFPELLKVKILPDHPLYFLKRIGEEIITFFTFGKENKLKRHLYLAEKRLAEVKALAEKKAKPELIEKTLQRYQKRLDKVEKYQLKIKRKKPIPELEEMLSEKLLNHQEILLQVKNKVPEKAKKGIENALKKSQYGFRKALESVSEKGRKRICPQIPVFAQNPQTKQCKEFSSPCHVPEGWLRVDTCEEIVSYEESPFAIHDPIVPLTNYAKDMSDLGAKWVRHAGRNGIGWGVIETQKGKYDWKYHDKIYLEASDKNIHIVAVISTYNPLYNQLGYLPKDMESYLNFLKKAVERYDGDGINDAPGSPVIEVWELENEPEHRWHDTIENYALLLKESYKVIKEANPNAKVAFAGLAGPHGTQTFLLPVVDVLNKIKDSKNDKYFDIVSFHWSCQFEGDYKAENIPSFGTYYLEESIKEMKEELNKRGYSVPIWITEMSCNDGNPTDKSPDFIKTESEQVTELVKRYVYSLAKGVNKIFWVTITEWHNFGDAGINNYFDNVGLINNPKNDGKDWKKLSYYTYKLMTEKLEGFNNIHTIKEKDNVYVYKFTKPKGNVYVAWWDYWEEENKKSKTITIEIDAKKVKITEAVPKYETGKEVKDYNTAFNTEIKEVKDEKLTLTLKESPVFIEVVEEKETPTLDYEESPFGIFGPYEFYQFTPEVASKEEIASYLTDLGVKWVQEMPLNIKWIPENINIYSRAGQKEISPEIDPILIKTIRENKERVKYWEAADEPDSVGGWGNDPEGYAGFLKKFYTKVKEECPDCYVVFGGLTPGEDVTGFTENSKSAHFLKSVLDAGAKGYFDVFEFKQSLHTAKDYKEIGNKMKVYEKILAEYGINIKKMPVFLETAIYDGDPKPIFNIPDPPYQSEAVQAQGLIKTYVYSLAKGIDKIFWNQIIELRGQKWTWGNPFEYYGLINNPAIDGQSHKKLAYYTYKKMVEVLERSDWDNIQTIQESDDIYIYKFINNGKPIWVAWNDNDAEKQITISGITSNQVKITQAVPKYESGKDITSYSTAFNTETKSVSNGKITLTLGDVPVFIEEQ